MAYQPTPAALSGRDLVGRRIRDTRTAQGLTQEQLAAAAGFDRSFLVDVENGTHSLMLDRLFDLASALQVPTASLVSDGT